MWTSATKDREINIADGGDDAGTERGADATDNGNANKSRIKMEQIASSENKGDARNETNGREEGS